MRCLEWRCHVEPSCMKCFARKKGMLVKKKMQSLLPRLRFHCIDSSSLNYMSWFTSSLIVWAFRQVGPVLVPSRWKERCVPRTRGKLDFGATRLLSENSFPLNTNTFCFDLESHEPSSTWSPLPQWLAQEKMQSLLWRLHFSFVPLPIEHELLLLWTTWVS